MASKLRGTVRIDNGPPLGAVLVVDQEMILVESLGSIPDRAWTHVDTAGHFHAWTTDETGNGLLGQRPARRMAHSE